MRTVSAAEANRHFSKLLRAVQAGERVVITSRGKPVAEMTPANDMADTDAVRRRAVDEFIARLRAQPALNLPRATRDDAYD